jgi:hypothetical protein
MISGLIMGEVLSLREAQALVDKYRDKIKQWQA